MSMAITEDRIRKLEDALLLLPEQLKGLKDAINVQNGNVADLNEFRIAHEANHRTVVEADKVAEALRHGQIMTISRGWKLVMASVGFVALIMPIAGFAMVLTRENSITDYDCITFSTQADAQRVFDRTEDADKYGLDIDGDGIACEELE